MFKFFSLLIVVILLIGTVLAGSFVWDAFLSSPKRDASSIQTKIPEGLSVNAIARLLKDQKIIESKFFFKTFVRLADVESSLQAGTFEFKPGMSFRAIVSTLTNAQAQEIQMTIPEGYTKKQIGELTIKLFPHISIDDWNATEIKEGYLFPDTYRFRKDADAKTITEIMTITLKQRLAESDIIVPEHLVMENGMTFHEVLTLASIVEREVRSKEDMAHIAGIFLTRLKIGMALQADSTVNYITGKADSAVSLSDSQIDSPYNTYKILGLPPGPISNPGINAILAVLEPVQSDDLYFLTTQEGQVVYAKTFDEHVKNKYKYLK